MLPRLSLRDSIAEYYPIVYPKHFWKVRTDMIPLSTRTPRVPLHVTFYPTSLLNAQAYAKLDAVDTYLKETPTILTTAFNHLRRWIMHMPWLLVGTVGLSFLWVAQRTSLIGTGVPVFDGWLSFSPISGFAAHAAVSMYLFSCKTDPLLLVWQLSITAYAAFRLFRMPSSELRVPVMPTDKLQKASKVAHWVGDAVIPATLALASALIFTETSSIYNGVVTSVTSFVYVTVLTSSIMQVVAPRTVPPISWNALALMAVNAILNNCITFMFGAPTLLQFAALRGDIAFLLFFGRWLSAPKISSDIK